MRKFVFYWIILLCVNSACGPHAPLRILLYYNVICPPFFFRPFWCILIIRCERHRVFACKFFYFYRSLLAATRIKVNEI